MSEVFVALRGVGTRLNQLGIQTVEDLVALNERELLSLPGIGPKALTHIVDALAAQGRVLAIDLYAAYVCARHSEQARDAELRSYFLCDSCRDDYSTLAFSDRPPEWVSTERVDGYCAHCNSQTEVRLSQWFLCGTCDRVIRSIGRGVASAKFVEASWAAAFGSSGDLALVETDPVTLQPRGRRSDPSRMATGDFEARRASGSVALGLELKTGRSALPGGGIGKPMAQFQLDTTDCDDIVAAARGLSAPVFLLHAQVIGRAEAPTERFEGVGLWFARPWDMRSHLEAVRQRPRETRDAAYFKTAMFRPFSDLPSYIETSFEVDLAAMKRDGFPTLYVR